MKKRTIKRKKKKKRNPKKSPIISSKHSITTKAFQV